MKTIWFDIFHPAQLNFYLHIIKILSKNNRIFVTVLGRGKLPYIAAKEFANIRNLELVIAGNHRGTRLSAIFEVNVLRPFKLCFVLLKKRIDLSFSNGYQAALLSKLFCYPSVTFGDDPHNSIVYRLKIFFADRSYYTLYSNRFWKVKKPAKILPCLKEWAYLSPRYFRPDIDVLHEYGLEPFEYIFVREISTGTINYATQRSGLVQSIQHEIPNSYKVVLSLENKSKRHLYPEDWILLEEPVKDFHSLIYYSRTLISSGDSMAREGALLGNPSFYIGIRNMPANEVLKELVDLHQPALEDFSDLFARCLSDFSIENKRANIDKLDHMFIDINEFILRITRKILR